MDWPEFLVFKLECLSVIQCLFRPIQASLWFIVDLRTWPCWKPPSRASRVSSKTASLLCRRPGTDVSAPPSTAGGATTWFGTSTSTSHGMLEPGVRWVSVRHNIGRLKFCVHRKSVKATIVEKFAGPYDRGEFTPSVQKTLYDSQVLILQRVPEVRLHFKAKNKINPSVKWTNTLSLKVEEIEIVMPNQHYFTIDMTKMGIVNKNEVCSVIDTHFENADLWHALLTFSPSQVLLPLDNPSGNITGTLRRKPQAKLWIRHFCDLCKSKKRWHIFYSVQ